MRNIRTRFHLMSVLLLLLAAVPVRAEDYGWCELDRLPGLAGRGTPTTEWNLGLASAQ